jgi:hypothetical protein
MVQGPLFIFHLKQAGLPNKKGSINYTAFVSEVGEVNNIQRATFLLPLLIELALNRSRRLKCSCSLVLALSAGRSPSKILTWRDCDVCLSLARNLFTVSTAAFLLLSLFTGIFDFP